MDSSIANPVIPPTVVTGQDHTPVSSFLTQRVTDNSDHADVTAVAAQTSKDVPTAIILPDAFPLPPPSHNLWKVGVDEARSEPSAPQSVPTSAGQQPMQAFQQSIKDAFPDQPAFQNPMAFQQRMPPVSTLDAPPTVPSTSSIHNLPQETRYYPPTSSNLTLAKDEYGPFPRRKQVRACQACDSCRQRKAKCDEGRPECGFCKDNGLKCCYRENPTHKSHNRDEALHEKLDAMQHGLDKVFGLFSKLSIDRDLAGPQYGLLGHFSEQAALPILPAEKLILIDLDGRLLRLSMSPQWPLMRSRLISYIASLESEARKVAPQMPLDPTSRAPPASQVLPPLQSNVGSPVYSNSTVYESQTILPSKIITEVPPIDHSLSRMSSMDSLASNTSTFPNKRKRENPMLSPTEAADDRPFFCFHESCAQVYKAGRALENHIRNQHKDRWPDLPGTCNHDGSIKTFRSWEDSLAHLIFHQKSFGMTRPQYDRILADAKFVIDHANMHTATTGRGFDLDFDMLGTDGVADINGGPWTLNGN